MLELLVAATCVLPTVVVLMAVMLLRLEQLHYRQYRHSSTTVDGPSPASIANSPNDAHM